MRVATSRVRGFFSLSLFFSLRNSANERNGEEKIMNTRRIDIFVKCLSNLGRDLRETRKEEILNIFIK